MAGARRPGPLGVRSQPRGLDDGTTPLWTFSPPPPVGVATPVHAVEGIVSPPETTDPVAEPDRAEATEPVEGNSSSPADLADRFCAQYREMSPEEPQVVSIEIEGYEFLFDLALERVVAVLGYSYVSTQVRDKRYMSGFLGQERSQKKLSGLAPSQVEQAKKSFRKRFQDKLGTKYDRGHFISLRQGGPYDINLFPQRADINQGRLDQWRDFERECVDNPGSLCYVRPVYDDDTWIPLELEYGIMRAGYRRTRTFPNKPAGAAPAAAAAAGQAAAFGFPLPQRPSPDWKGGKRFFGAPRSKGRLHAGCDLLAPPGTPVHAIADGTLVRGPYQFTGPKQNLAVTHAVEIHHPPYLVRYGEIMPGSYVGGSTVKKGQVIAKVGALKMLHFELYKNGASKATLNGPLPYRRRSDVMDAGPLLEQWVKELPGK